MIGRWFERVGPVLSSVNPCLMFNYDESTLAVSLRRSKVVVVLDQRIFRRKHKKPHHLTIGAVFNPFGQRPSPLIVVPTFPLSHFPTLPRSRAPTLPRPRQPRSCLLDKRHSFASPALGGARAPSSPPSPPTSAIGWHSIAQMRAAGNEQAVLILDNAQIHAYPEAIRVFRGNHVPVITLPPLCAVHAASRRRLGKAFQCALFHVGGVGGGRGHLPALGHAPRP